MWRKPCNWIESCLVRKVVELRVLVEMGENPLEWLGRAWWWRVALN